MRARLALALMLALLACPVAAQPAPPAEPPLLMDLTDGQVSINTGFSGQRLVLFGAMDAPGDLVVVIEGPAHTVTVRRKERHFGLWLNGAAATYENVPSFYTLVSTKPLEALLPQAALESQELGLSYIYLQPTGADLMAPLDAAEFRQALVDGKRARGTYKQFESGGASADTGEAPGQSEGEIVVRGGRLFRTAIEFPDNVPTGSYSATVFLLREGRIVDAATGSLVIEKVGTAARISAFARQSGALYGLSGIAIACALGWAASLMFRKG